MERIKKVAFIRLKDIWFDTDLFQLSNSSIIALHTNDILEKKNYDFVLYTKTFLLSIEGDIDSIFAKFDYKSAKYAINKAIRDGVTVSEIVTEEQKLRYLNFQKEFCDEKKIPLFEADELQDLRCFYAISKEKEYLGACAFIESSDKKTVRYKYGATLHKLNANELILWHAIKYYHSKGFKYFDFGGCIPTNDKKSYYYRHFQFKKKFGGELVDSYTYFRIKGIYHFIVFIYRVILKVIFKEDQNKLTNYLYRIKILN